MTDFLMLLILILLIGLGLWALADFCFSIRSIIKCKCGKFAYYVPTVSKVKQDIIFQVRQILTNSKKQLKVVDLGSGTGSLLLPLAKEFPNHLFVGYEWDPVLIKISIKKSKNLKNIMFKPQNFMEADLSSFDLFLCFVLKCQGEDVGKKLNKEMKNTAVCIAEKFELKHLKEIKRIHSRTFWVPFKIFIYVKK